MGKKVLIATGGTGGHIHPAQALASSLLLDDSELEVLLAGKGLVGSPYLAGSGLTTHEVVADPVSHRHILDTCRGIGRMTQGLWQSLRLIRSWKPDLVVGFGSYHSAPLLTASLLCRIPMVLHEANSIPGKVVRLFSPWAKATGVHLPVTGVPLGGKVVEVGMPLRSGYHQGEVSQEEARRYFDLLPHRLTFLAFGGSQGAFAVNTLFCNAMVDHLVKYSRSFQVLHITGASSLQPRILRAYEDAGIRAYVTRYEQRMDLAWQAADLMVGRSGAGTIAEMMEMEVPAILIPYPHAANHHQHHNGAFMAHTIGGATLCRESELTPALLAEEVKSLLADEHSALASMRESMHGYKHSHHHRSMHDLVSETLGTKMR